MYLNSPSSSLIGISVEFLDHSGTNLLNASSSSWDISYKAFAPSVNATGAAVVNVARPNNLFIPSPYAPLSRALFLTTCSVPSSNISVTVKPKLLPLILTPAAGMCLISFKPSSAMLVVVLIISDGNDMKLPTGNSLAVLTAEPTNA